MAGVITPLFDEAEERKIRFQKLKRMFLDGSITEDTCMILYYEPEGNARDGETTASDVVFQNVRPWEVATYLELIKMMVMQTILVEDGGR